jgi:hypothetical protein
VTGAWIEKTSLVTVRICRGVVTGDRGDDIDSAPGPMSRVDLINGSYRVITEPVTSSVLTART